MTMHDEAPLTEAERNALRAFLQRCEVRISTQHRIAIAFIGGAGLLLLIPIFFRDVVDGVLAVMLSLLGNQFPQWGAINGWAASLLLFGALIYPLLLSLAIPLYGVYLLLMDIVHFYYSLYAPQHPDSVMNPSFSLTGLTFPIDESPVAKRAILRFVYNKSHARYMMPFSEGRYGLYFDALADQTEDMIIAEGRTFAALNANDSLPPDCDERHARRVSTAFGMSRSLDRTLIEEVAVTEMLLTRNIIYLRRLLLRYVKTLILFIWTTAISFLLLPFLQDDRFPTLLVLGVGYVVWSVGVLPLIRIPFNWIYRHRQVDDPMLDPANHVDSQLTLLDEHIRPLCYASIVLALSGTLLALVGYAG